MMDCTFGNWETEADSMQALDLALTRIGLWKVYSEVPGVLLQPRPAQNENKVRIDRVLVPNERLISLGWEHGIIGIEGKKSGQKIGPPISQAIASILAQNRIGTADGNQWTLLRLKAGEQSIINVSHKFDVRIGNGGCGQKVGHR